MPELLRTRAELAAVWTVVTRQRLVERGYLPLLTPCHGRQSSGKLVPAVRFTHVAVQQFLCADAMVGMLLGEVFESDKARAKRETDEAVSTAVGTCKK